MRMTEIELLVSSFVEEFIDRTESPRFILAAIDENHREHGLTPLMQLDALERIHEWFVNTSEVDESMISSDTISCIGYLMERQDEGVPPFDAITMLCEEDDDDSLDTAYDDLNASEELLVLREYIDLLQMEDLSND